MSGDLLQGGDRVGLYVRVVLWCTANDAGPLRRRRRALAIVLRVNARARTEGWYPRLASAFRGTPWAAGAGTSRV